MGLFVAVTLGWLFVRGDLSKQTTRRTSFIGMRDKSQPRRHYLRRIAVIASKEIAIVLTIVFLVALYPSMFIQDPWDAIPKATSEKLAKLHDPGLLRADLDAIIALHERTSPNPYLRVSKESIAELAKRLKASITRPMTRREFLPIVMELQAGYRSDHYSMDFPRRISSSPWHVASGCSPSAQSPGTMVWSSLPWPRASGRSSRATPS